MDYSINNKSRKQKKRNKFIDTGLKNTYGKWIPIKGMSRSFFIWKGKFSGSFKEMAIGKILKSQNLNYYCEVSFDLKRRFDFYIPLIDLVIEYDGEQHFMNSEAMKKDVSKESLLNKLGIKLIRYNKSHNLKEQILYDLIHHPVLLKK